MRRLRITIVGFCVLVLGYRIYAMTLVPWIEPPEVSQNSSASDQGSVIDFATEERTNFRDFLPPNAWERSPDASILESEQGALIFMKHKSLEDGTIKLSPLTLVYYAQDKNPEADSKNSDGQNELDDAGSSSAGSFGPNSSGIADGANLDGANSSSVVPERSKTPIFVQAPDGAILETDQPINLARLDVGNPVSARLLGEVTIHRPNSAGANEEDDSLWLVTRNLKVTQTQIITPQSVEFRLGPHWGYGEDLEIELTKPSKRRDTNASFGRIRNMTLHRLERVMVLTDDGLLRRAGDKGANDKVSSNNDSSNNDSSNNDSGVQPPPPLAVSAHPEPKPKTPIEIRSSGPFEFDMASWRATLTGNVVVTRVEQPFTDTIACHRLTVLFNEPADDDSNLSFNKLIAEGLPDAPVQLSIPSQEVAGQGHRLTCYYDDRRILFEDQRGAWFRHRETEIEVPVLDYYLHPDSSRRLGQFDGKGGGVMRGVVEQEDKKLPILLSWMNSIQVRPTETQDMRVISVFGKSHIEIQDTGTFDARELHMFVREEPRIDLKDRWQIVPDQLFAKGDVRVKSTRLTGSIDEVRVWFVPDEDNLPEPLSDSILPPGETGESTEGSAIDAKSELMDDSKSPPMHVEGGHLHARVLRGQKPKIDDVTIFGNVVVTKPLGKGRQPFEVRGETVQLSQIQTNDPQVRVRTDARIKADGIEVRGERVFVSGLRNELWIYGPGQLFAPPRRPTPNRPLQQDEMVHITWQDGLKFDGAVATIRDQVAVVGQSHLEKTDDVATFNGKADQVRMTLDRQISFLKPPRREEAKDIVIKSVRFDGPASGTNTTNDPFGVQLSYDELSVRDMEIWPETGDLSGGPGWIRTIRYGESFRQSADSKKSELMHVEIHFADSIRGNFEQKDITFSGDVHTIAGPIEHWRQRLDPNVPDGLGEDGVEIFSQKLRGVEFTLNQQESYLELIADGNVKVHNLQFSAFADRLTYNDSKDLITLKGIGAGRLARVESVFRGVPHQGNGRELQIWPKRKHVEWEEIQRLEFGGRPKNSR